MAGESDMNSELSFFEFREFCKSNFKHTSNQDISKLYRIAWNFGNGAVNFDNFLGAAEEMRIFVRELQMENSASLALSHANTKVEERIASLTYMDNLCGSLQGLTD